jgi:hypothetical protein
MNENDEQYELCFKVLRRLESAGVLHQIVLIGSWCAYFYKDYFEEELPAPRTRDIDFLIATPPKIKPSINIPAMLTDLNFLVQFHSNGAMRIEHPKLIVDFLVPEKGKGGAGPYKIKELGVTVQQLRFVSLLLDNTISFESHGFHLTLPHPINFSLQKLIISGRRTKVEKADKDRKQAIDVLKMVMATKEKEKIRPLFEKLPKGWRAAIIKTLKAENQPDVLEVLSAEH